MKKLDAHARKFLTALTAILFLQLALVIPGCKKDKPEVSPETQSSESRLRKKPGNPPPPPPPFYFSNCNNPTNSATFTKGVATNTAIVKNYVNSPGGSYSAFTSATVNGVTITAAAGTFNVGSGQVTFTATGTPISTGFYNVWIQVGNIQPCMMFFTVGNAPVSGPTADPGAAPGSLGIVNFTYRGQSVAYQTVRAKDGKIWLQQNLGSPQVAFHHLDESSYGDYFQWGRWDDGHQARNSTPVTGGPSLLNPSNISSGNSSFIIGTTASTTWWGTGGAATDTWSGTTASSTNGKDPCTALGAGWHMPTSAEWANLKNYEDLDGAMAAFMSNLKLPAAGYRDAYGGFVYSNGESFYWTATALTTYATGLFISDNTYLANLQATDRGEGYSCRCVK